MAIEPPRSYPDTRFIDGREVTLRPMTAGDRQAVLDFARRLPEHDLLFLRRDITQESAVDEWIGEIGRGEAFTILALSGGEVIGYATIHRNQLRWTAHVAELRVVVAEAARGLGLGRMLTQEAFANAVGLGIEKMVAQMTVDQKGAIAVFESLGFRPEAILRDQVKDRAGQKHDLLVLSHDVSKFERERRVYGIEKAFGP